MRRAASCPAFDNSNLMGGGCQEYSTFANQKVPLRCQRTNRTPVYINAINPAVLDSTVIFEPVSSIECKQSKQWNIDPSNVTCVKDCMANVPLSRDQCQGQTTCTKTVFTKVGDRRQLPPPRKGHRWVDENDNPIRSVKCLTKDVGQFNLVSYEEFHRLVDIDECTEDFTLCKPLGFCNNTVGSYDCDCLNAEKVRRGGKTMCRSYDKVLLQTGTTPSAQNDDTFDIIRINLNSFEISRHVSGSVPQAVSGASGFDDNSLVCGGYESASRKVTNKCFGGGAGATTSMKGHRLHASSARVGDKYLVTGGWDGSNKLLRSMEFIVPGRPNSPPATDDEANMNLPLYLFGHALVRTNISALMVIGGCAHYDCTSNKTYVTTLSSDDGQQTVGRWTDGPDLNTGRHWHTAGLITDRETQEHHLVVAGGVGAMKSVEIMFAGDTQWTKGPDLLGNGIYGHAMVGLDTDLLVMGGNDGQDIQSSIFRLECRNRRCQWEPNGQLPTPREFTLARAVPTFDNQ